MSTDVSGVYTLPSADIVNGQTADATPVQDNFDDLASGMTERLTKTGKTTPTADLPMGSFKHTTVGAASARTDYARADQVIGSVLDYAIDTGTATAYAIAPSPGISAYVVGQRFAFNAIHANSGVDPTLAVNSLTAGIIYYPDGTSLAAADITLNGLYEVLVATVSAGTPTFHLQSPTAGEVRKGGTQTITGAKTFSAATTMSATLSMSAAAFNEAVRVDVASATTCDIGAAASNYVRITGTTTITGLGTVASGVRRHVVFGDALLLTYNATSLILPSAASITSVAGDTALFISEGSGNWRCLEYTRATGVPVAAGQFVYTETGAYSSGSTALLADDSIPQNTEGDEYMTLAITPRSATSKLVIDVHAELAASGADLITGALFQDSTAGALAAMIVYVAGAGTTEICTFRHIMTSGTTSATTFKFRAGANGGTTVGFNGYSGARKLGGVAASSISIQEIS